MNPWLDDGDIKLYQGEALATLREMPSESVQMIMTSPPFWGLRSYIDDRHADKPLEIGLEETPELWCNRLVDVFREARRVLRSDGCMWLECGDTYNGAGSSNGNGGQIGQGPSNRAAIGLTRPDAGMKQKDLVGAPWLLAFALRADGWYLRSDTIWARPNPMPESVTDRPTKAHSYVFLLTKQARYYFDSDAIREPHTSTPTTNGTVASYSPGSASSHRLDGGHEKRDGHTTLPVNPAGRNARSVWNIATEPTPFAHFATFPQALVERCVKSGSAEGDVILDPFVGSGTTCLVARRLGRHAWGIELNAEYLRIAAKRLEQPTLWSQPV